MHDHPLPQPFHSPPVPLTTCPLLLAFRREWRVLSRRRSTIARARRWGVTDEPFQDLDDLLALSGYRASSNGAADELLRRLVGVAHGDELAARVVLQRILPGLAALARRRRVYGAEDAMDEIVGAAWIAIRTYRFEVRRDHVAGNLVRDAAYAAFVLPQRRMSASEISLDPRILDDRPAVEQESPCDELIRVLAEAQADGVPVGEVELVRELLRDGSEAVAAARQVSSRTIRNRRDRATARIRGLTMAA